MYSFAYVYILAGVIVLSHLANPFVAGNTNFRYLVPSVCARILVEILLFLKNNSLRGGAFKAG